ncbi:MAG: tetratricopeptide repeat protein [bacterium]
MTDEGEEVGMSFNNAERHNDEILDLFDRQGLLEEADKFSAQAYQSFPWVPAFKGTRGIVLVELGELDKGIVLLKQAMKENEETRSKAIDAAYLAIAEGRKGNFECAKQYLDIAIQFDATCSLIERAQNELLHA